MNNNPHNDWDNLFEQLPLDTQPRDEHREQLKARALEAFDQEQAAETSQVRPRSSNNSQRSPENGLTNLGRILMNNKTPYWTAAVILIGCFTWLLQGTNTAFAFEELVNKVVNCRAVRYDMEFEIDGKTMTVKNFYLDPGRTRTESAGGAISITDSGAQKVLVLEPTLKTAILTTFKNGQPADLSENLFETMRDALLASKTDVENKVTPLGEKVIDGKTTLGFQSNTMLGLQKSVQLTIWADPKTHFPVEIEMDIPSFTTLVMKNYEFDVELDEALFSLDTPEGYTLQSASVDLTDPTEAVFVAKIKEFAETMDKLPTALDPGDGSAELAKYVQKKNIKAEDTQQAMLDMIPMLTFPSSLPPSADAHYEPEDVTIGDGSKAFFWYKPEDSENYRVVYGDFSVKEQSQAPEASDENE